MPASFRLVFDENLLIVLQFINNLVGTSCLGCLEYEV